MKKSLAILVSIIFSFKMTLPVIFFMGVAQASTKGPDQKIINQLMGYVEGTRKLLGNCPTGVVVSRNGETIFEKYYPGSDSQGALISVSEKSLWPILSSTKSFVSGMLLSLVSDKIIALDDPIKKYLPVFGTCGDGPYDRRNVTLRHLASHTSGIALPKNKQIFPPLVPDLKDIQIDTEPGTIFSYSGLGMHILEKVVEAATGEDFEETMQKRILVPLKLKHTRYIYEYDPTLAMLPIRSDIRNNPGGNFSLSARGYRAHSGLYSTARELNRYGQLWLSNGNFENHFYFRHEFKQEAWKTHAYRKSDGTYYGLLWWLFEREGGYVMSGDLGKVTAVVPETNVVITVLRVPLKPIKQQFNFTEDKRKLVLFGKML